MGRINISLPPSLEAFIEEQVTALGYGSSGEYVREMIRKERDRRQLRGLLLEGAGSPPGGLADAAWFDGLRDRIGAKGA